MALAFKMLSLIIVFLTYSTWVSSQQFQQQPPAPHPSPNSPGAPAHPGQPPVPQNHPGQPPSSFGGDETKDQQHIKSHLDGQMNAEKKMTDDEMRFHYFKLYDHDNNNCLDGLELIQAITHYHGDANNAPPPKFQDSELDRIVDDILREDDYNNDGCIDYSEFVKSQAARTSATTVSPT